MAKYIFSQGKVQVEDGMYRPVLTKERGKLDSVVLIVLPSPQREPSTRDKEETSQVKAR